MKKVLLPFAALVLSAMPAMAGANVYASGLKAENGKISFILNDKADKVILNLLDGETIVATADLGACEKGLNTLDMPSINAEPGTYTWSLTVSAAAVSEVTLLTDGTNTDIQTSSARGIAVDNHQQSPAFGTIYTVTPATPGQEGARTETGLYAFNAALEPINETAYTGGIEWPEKSASSPNNVAVADNGDVFICSWGDDAANGVYWAAPGKLAEDWNDVFAAGEKDGNGLMTIDGTAIHGSIQDLALYGEGENRILYTSDEDYGPTEYENIMVYAIGDLATPWATAPTHDWGYPEGYINSNHRIYSDGRGGLWLCQYRWQESAANACIYHLNANGELDFQTGDKSIFLGSGLVGAMGVNADYSLICVADSGNGATFTVASIAWGEDGIPSLTKLYSFSLAPYGNRPFDIAFDAADNLYIIFNNANETGGIGAWALPKEKNEYTTTALGTISVSTDGIESQICETPITYSAGIIRATEEAEVYTTAGICIARGTEIDANTLAGGVYIVRAGKNTLRIIR